MRKQFAITFGDDFARSQVNNNSEQAVDQRVFAALSMLGAVRRRAPGAHPRGPFGPHERPRAPAIYLTICQMVKSAAAEGRLDATTR